MDPRNSKTSFFAPWNPNIASRRTLDSPQQRPRRPHREAEDPKQPPRPSFRYRRLSVPDESAITSIEKKRQQGTSPRHFRGDIGAVEFNVFSFVSSLDDLLLLLLLLLPFLLCPFRLLHYHYKTKAKTRANARTKIKTKNEIRTKTLSKAKTQAKTSIKTKPKPTDLGAYYHFSKYAIHMSHPMP